MFSVPIFMEQKPKSQSGVRDYGIGLAPGIAIGAALGAAFDNIAVGIAIGVAIGVAIAAARRRRGEKQTHRSGTDDADQDQDRETGT